jgi:hypothetical protein
VAEDKEGRDMPREIPPELSNKPQPQDSMSMRFPTMKKDRYTISLFLPMYLDSLNREVNQKTQLTVAREFYKGFSIGADTLRKCGMSLDLHVFDSEQPWNYSSVEDTVLKNNTDLIIGPILDGRIKNMDSVSKKNKINYVSSLLANDKSTNKDYYFQSRASSTGEALAAAKVTREYFKGYKIIYIADKKIKGNAFAETLMKQFGRDSLTILECNGKGASVLPENLPLADSNIIIMPARSETFVTAVLSKLTVSTQKIVIIGDIQWQFFRNFDPELWDKFQVHLISPYFIDYGDPSVNGFITSYRQRYREEPTIWSFIGFDEMVYYGNLMQKYGRYFQAGITTQHMPLLHTTYHLRATRRGNGWHNEYVNVLKFQNYKLTRVVY